MTDIDTLRRHRGTLLEMAAQVSLLIRDGDRRDALAWALKKVDEEIEYTKEAREFDAVCTRIVANEESTLAVRAESARMQAIDAQAIAAARFDAYGADGSRGAYAHARHVADRWVALTRENA